jgi:hypothetical protein
MFNEPIEITVVNPRRRWRSAPRHRGTCTTTDSAIVDQAFAELPGEVDDRRLDHSQAAVEDIVVRDEKALLGRIATEVASLNRRCTHLSEMLRKLDPPTTPRG